MAVGSVALRPVVDDLGAVTARRRMTLNLVCDHRILYGAEASQFVTAIRDALERSLSLLE